MLENELLILYSLVGLEEGIYPIENYEILVNMKGNLFDEENVNNSKSIIIIGELNDFGYGRSEVNFHELNSVISKLKKEGNNDDEIIIKLGIIYDLKKLENSEYHNRYILKRKK